MAQSPAGRLDMKETPATKAADDVAAQRMFRAFVS